MPEHRTLVSADVHEPKHITNTTGADAGKVITPLGGGASELRRLSSLELSDTATLVRTTDNNKAYGEAGIDANLGSPIAVTAASSSSLYNITDYIPLNSTNLAGVTEDEVFNVTFDSVDNSLTPTISGVYVISFWMNVKSDEASNIVGTKLKANGSWADFTIKNEVKDAGRIQNISGFITKHLNAGDPVSVYIASEKATNIHVEDFRFELILLRAV